MSPRLLRFLMGIIEATSIPLLVIGLVYLITGYQLLNPSVRIFPYPRMLHTDRVLRIALISLSLLHSYAGLCLLIARRARRKANALITLVTLVLALMVALFAFLEVSSTTAR